ncbi:RNA-directed DNA polymerase, eukaryota [Tanacetum coccineum]
MSNKFRYLGVMVGEYSSRIKAWDDVILKLRSRLSKWKVKTLSIGGRLTLLKSVLGASPIYNMSIFKVPTGVLKVMESIRSRFFNGADQSEKKVTWVAWNKVLASKKHGGLGVSSFFALNRALLLKWVWRFVSQDGSLWYKVIRALYGSSILCSIVGSESSSSCSNFLAVRIGPEQRSSRWLFGEPRQDCLPTRVNLIRRGITIESSLCPVCSVCEEDVCHIFFRCDLAQLVLRRICRWWAYDLSMILVIVPRWQVLDSCSISSPLKFKAMWRECSSSILGGYLEL